MTRCPCPDCDCTSDTRPGYRFCRPCTDLECLVVPDVSGETPDE